MLLSFTLQQHDSFKLDIFILSQNDPFWIEVN
jgi:hypothetical protein